jgi:dynein heavy chain
MDKYVISCVEFVLEGIEDDVITRKLKQTVPHTNLNMVTQLCNLLEALLTEDKNIQDPQVRTTSVRLTTAWTRPQWALNVEGMFPE